jgi:CRISPR system Cascade subunit CasD
MSEMFILLLRLEGPMQSWGYRSRFDYRDTALEPTRSGVIGLLCAAMGIARGEDISRFDAIRIGVRVDKEGRVERDYHTALDVIKADGRVSDDAVVSRRDYLADASFTVGLECEDKALLECIAEHLRSPRWPLCLGRLSFPLAAAPLESDQQVVSGSLEEHLLVDEKQRRVVIEAADGECTQHDWPLCFGERRFKPRRFHVEFTRNGADQ